MMYIAGIIAIAVIWCIIEEMLSETATKVGFVFFGLAIVLYIVDAISDLLICDILSKVCASLGLILVVIGIIKLIDNPIAKAGWVVWLIAVGFFIAQSYLGWTLLFILGIIGVVLGALIMVGALALHVFAECCGDCCW